MRGQKVFFFFRAELMPVLRRRGQGNRRVIASDAPFYMAGSYHDSVKLAT